MRRQIVILPLRNLKVWKTCNTYKCVSADSITSLFLLVSWPGWCLPIRPPTSDLRAHFRGQDHLLASQLPSQMLKYRLVERSWRWSKATANRELQQATILIQHLNLMSSKTIPPKKLEPEALGSVASSFVGERVVTNACWHAQRSSVATLARFWRHQRSDVDLFTFLIRDEKLSGQPA